MRVLFLHSGPELTGSYTYAKALESAWGSSVQAFYINDGMPGAPPPAAALPMARKLFPRGFMNAARVARFARAHQVDILHSHSRRANVVAALASKLAAIPYVTTAHLSQAPHAFNRLWPCFGDHAIAICENIEDNLLHAHGLPRASVSLIRNGIDLEAYAPVPPPTGSPRWITVVGRLSGRRWRAALFVLAVLEQTLKAFADTRARFFGAVEPVHRAQWDQRLQQLESALGPGRVVYGGFAEDIRPLLAGSAVVIGAGRSLLEALAMERPALAVGEQEAPGLLTPANFTQAQRSNFGDFRHRSDGSAVYDPAGVRAGLQALLEDSLNPRELTRWGREQVEQHYDVRRVAAQVREIYERWV